MIFLVSHAMNVFVTGGAGYIGSVCVERLVEAGHTVTVFDNLSEGHREAVHAGARLVVGELGEREALCHAVRKAAPEAIIHFAACALVGESMTNPGKYFRNNVAHAVNLLDAAVAVNARRFVFSSTCATYGPPARTPVTEEEPQQPINPYGESKLMFERMLAWYGRIHGLPFSVFRYFNAAGASGAFGEDHRVETHLIPNLLKVALGQAPHAEVFGADYPTPDGTCIRDYIHVSDLAAAHIAALGQAGSQVFNLGNGTGASVREVIAACRAVSGRSIPVVEKPRREGDPPVLVAAADKARTTLGWTPSIPALADIVESAWRWHRAHPHGYSSR